MHAAMPPSAKLPPGQAPHNAGTMPPPAAGALVFWNYAAALVAVPAWMVGYLWMLGAFGLYSS